MRRRARRYWGGLLVVGLLIIPAYGSDTPVGPSAAPVRFLATAEVLSRAIQTLSSFATESPILLPIMGDPKPTAPQTALRSAVHGSSASLVTASFQPAFVIVQDGQTLWEIAQTYGVSVDYLVEANGLSSGDLIHPGQRLADRKSTRLNSSHLVISYAVFCLKKKKENKSIILRSRRTKHRRT